MTLHTTSRRGFVTAVGVGGLALAGTGVATAAGHQRTFHATLSGANEVSPVDTRARGQAIFKLNAAGDALHYRLVVANIEDVFMAHIHNAPPGTNGGIVTWLYPADGPPTELIPDRFSGVLDESTITDADLVGSLAGDSVSDLIALIRDGDTYVNVHTLANPSGEIRGQIG